MRISFIFLLAWLCAMPVFAATGGSISGLVMDPSRAVISDVVVVARNTNTGIVQKAATSSAGFYAFPTLPSGHYELLVEHAGFKHYQQKGIEVTSNAAVRVDIQLSLGSHTETLLVTESPTQVEITNTQMGDLITSTKMTDIPVNGRSYTDLLALQTV